MIAKLFLRFLAAAALLLSSCGGRSLAGYGEDPDIVGDGDGDIIIGDGDGDIIIGDGDGDVIVGDGDGDIIIGDGDGDVIIGDGDGDVIIGDGDVIIGDGDGDIIIGDGDGDIVVPPAGSCADPLVLTTDGATGSDGSGWDRYVGSCPGDGDEVVFYFQAPEDGKYAFDTRGSGFDTTLHLTTDACGGVVLACNDDYYDLDALVEADLQAGEGVYLILQAFDGDVWEHRINVSVERDAPPEPTNCPSASLGSNLGQPLLVEEIVTVPYPSLPNDGACSGGPAVASYSWTAPATGNYIFNTSGSNFDTVLALRTACNGSLYDCNDDSYQWESRIEYSFEAGQTIVIEVSAFGGTLNAGGNPDFGGPTIVLSIWAD